METTQEKETVETDTVNRRINKTNLEYARHHYNQAFQSLCRAQERMHSMSQNPGGAGEMAHAGFEEGVTAGNFISASIEFIDRIDEQRKAFFG